MIIFRCDRCGKVFDKAELDRTCYIGEQDEDGYNAHTLDLCDDCYAELSIWLHNPRGFRPPESGNDNPNHWREVTDKTERDGG